MRNQLIFCLLFLSTLAAAQHPPLRVATPESVGMSSERLLRLDALLQREFNSSFSEALTEFATWNLLTGKYSDSARAYDRVTEQEGAPVPSA